MKALEKLRAYLHGEGMQHIHPPRQVFVGVADKLRIKPKPKRKRKGPSNVVKIIHKAAEK